MLTSDYHVHSYATSTSLAHGHVHGMVGVTGNSIPYCRSHVHHYAGVTTFDDGHVHYYTGTTGPAIYLPQGGHTHSYGGITSIDNAHAHSYAGQTSLAEFAHLFNKAYG